MIHLHFDITYVSLCYMSTILSAQHVQLQIYPNLFRYIIFKPLKRTAIFRKSRSRTCRRYFFADCTNAIFVGNINGREVGREKYQRFQTRKTYSTATEHSRDEARSNADLITGQTSRESRPGRDFISSVVGEMRRRKAGEGERKSRKRENRSPLYIRARLPISVSAATCRTKRFE